MRRNFDSLNSSYSNLNTTFNQYKESTQNELSYTENFVYILTATTAILIVATIHLVLRKPETKTKAEKD